ncbi:MAG: flavodoxin [Pseudomonadota bacterium]
MDTSHLNDLKVGLIFGSDTGNTEEIGEKIVDRFADLDCHVEIMDVVDYTREKTRPYDFIIMGIPTWDFGGIHSDWEHHEDEILKTDLKGKVVALYGLGDQAGYGEWFLDAMGWLHERVVKVGASVIGRWSTEGYHFSASLATNEDKSQFCGLAIDEDEQAYLTEERLDKWVAQVVEELKTSSG